jgi:CheY-like chemotaxis protein
MTKFTEKNIVLYADDDPDDLMLVTDAFYRYTQNIEVVTASDGAEALSYLKNLTSIDSMPCLIILDINMPRLNGKEALMNIRSMKRFEEIPVVLFTTSSQPSDKTFANTYNAGFLKKPIDISQMEIITDQFIQHCAEEVRKKLGRLSQ